MQNQHAMTPEGFRTAAYLEARARLDARRKTKRNVQCNPPNVRCGNRCIPPSWDCRLKGEGGDKHLAAVKTDPLGGLANIERGSRRIIRGVAKGSFSEVEGGKRAIIRGTVKIAPGNLQQKKELQAKLENRTRAIGIGLAVLTGGLGAHAVLMKQSPLYRQGLGRSINESVQHGINSILDATPGIAGRRTRTRMGAFGALYETAERERLSPTISPATLTSGLEVNAPAALNQLRNTSITSNVTGNSNLNNALNKVNTQARQNSTSNIYEWDQKHREAFWNTTIAADEIKRDANVFARPAAENFIRSQYNISPTGSAVDLKEALRLKLSEERNTYVLYAKQSGFRTVTKGGIESVHQDDQFRFIQTLNRNALVTGTLNKSAKDLADAHVAKLISPTSLTNYSRSIYNKNLDDFDRFYTQVGAAVRSTPGAASLREEVSLNTGQRGIPSLSNEQRDFLSALSQKRVEEMSSKLSSARLNNGQNVGIARPIAGSGHAELVKTAYFHVEVIGRGSQRRPSALNRGNANTRSLRTYTITDRLATSAASEIAGRSVADPAEAFRLLNSEYGFPGAIRVQAAAPARRQSTGAARQAGLSTLARDIMARSGNEGMTLEAALRAARQERGDSSEDLVAPEVVRTATYLVARADLRGDPRLGKPCGASHIPKAHECRKGQESRGAEATQGTAKRSKDSTNLTILGVLAGSAVLATSLYVLKDLKKVEKQTHLFSASPSIKTVAKQAKKDFGTKKSGTAMGMYYTKKSGLKPGDTVYYRSEKDPAAHFGIYLGEGKDGKVRAVMASTSKDRVGFIDIFEIGTTKPDSNDAAHFLLPTLQKAPPIRGLSRRTNEEVVQRAIRAVGSDYKFTLTKDNCEVIANAIAYDTPKSQQLERFSKLTRQVADITVGNRQRAIGMARRAQGQRKGTARTARQIMAELNKSDTAFLTAEGKAIAEQHYNQFFRTEGRNDSADFDFGELLSPPETWKQIKDLEAMSKVAAIRDYLLMLRIAVEPATPYEKLQFDELIRTDKRCGKSYIPKHKKCVKPIVQGALVAAGAGLVAGAYLLHKKRRSGTLAQMIPLPSNKSADDWFALPRIPGATEGSRARKYSSNLEMEPIDNATFTKAIKNIAGGTPEGQLMANLIEKRGIKTNSRIFETLKSADGMDSGTKETYNELIKVLDKQPVFLGAFIDPHYPGNNSVPPENEIWINHSKISKTDFTPSKAGVTTALQKHIKARQNSLSVEEISSVARTGGASKDRKIAEFTRAYQTYSMADGDDRDFIIAIHESAHALDIGFARRKRSVVDPINNAAFERQANKIVSHYGLSDIKGKRDEFFAESAVLYTLDPNTLKKQAPMVYSWVDSYLKEMSRLS